MAHLKNILDRFYSKLEEKPNGCIVWTGSRKGEYGYFHIRSPHTDMGAHVFAFILHYKIEPLEDVHHKCENKLCCNPLHLESKTRMEHKLLHVRKDFCMYGHELKIVGRNKHGACKECTRIRARKQYNKIKDIREKLYALHP